jgi:hypothetical protein
MVRIELGLSVLITADAERRVGHDRFEMFEERVRFAAREFSSL